jgi:2-alkyl-3-oxoalkanoate reductase
MITYLLVSRLKKEDEMKVMVTGAAGAVGGALVPALVRAGHEVVGTTRSEAKASRLREAGAEGLVLDVLDRRATLDAVGRARPDAIVHQATALTGAGNLRKFDQEFALTNRLRTEGTENLLGAAEASGVRRFLAQSYAGWPYAREGGPVKTEEDPLDPHVGKEARETLAAIRRLEADVTSAGGLALRYGGFYGPGTGIEPGGPYAKLLEKRRFPVVGSGEGIWSFIHIDDVAAATVAALERGASGVYNVVDDEPAAVKDWLPTLAAALGAKPPRHAPAWLGRLLLGEHGMNMMETTRGASNAKAKAQLGWKPIWPTWREGFRRGLSRTRDQGRGTRVNS